MKNKRILSIINMNFIVDDDADKNSNYLSDKFIILSFGSAADPLAHGVAPV